MRLKLTIDLVFEVDGREPTAFEKAVVFEQIVNGWPSWVFTCGDERAAAEGALVLEEIRSTRWTRHKTQE